MSDPTPLPSEEPPARHGCPLCDGCDLDAADLAILSYVAGLVSLVLAFFAVHHRLIHFLALPLGLLAVAAGYKSSKVATPKQKMAER
ncbi:MAG: hypothetical protein HUU35_18960, partial [Armatimonadetes bacterium]|nr:hypothetical protein [Armatimonadota bacterium]